MLSRGCRAILCAKLRALANAPPVPAPIPPTQIQPPPRANLRKMAGASSATGPLAIGALGAVGLLNDTQAAEWMIIWDVRITSVPNPIPSHLIVADLVIGTGRNSGSLFSVGNNRPLVSFVAAMPGSTWTLNSPNNEIAKPFHSVTLIPSGNTANYEWPHEWPVCAIAPGDSVVAYSDADAYFDFAAEYIYEMFTGIL